VLLSELRNEKAPPSNFLAENGDGVTNNSEGSSEEKE
jgi:hypothetical protein